MSATKTGLQGGEPPRAAAAPRPRNPAPGTGQLTRGAGRTLGAVRPVQYSAGYQPALDGLRGLAVLAVIGYHLDLAVDQRGGATGVTLFFVLSGYLITTLLLREVDATGGVRLGNFYARRALRLFPALLLLLAATAAYAAIWAPPEQAATSFRVLPYVLLYVGNWYRALSGFGSLGLLDHTWSLSLEEQFYLLWPPVLVGALLLLGVRRSWRPSLTRPLLGLALLGSIAPLLVRLLLWHGSVASGARVYSGTDTAMDPLLMGCALALAFELRAHRPARSPGPSRRRALGGLDRVLALAFWPAVALLLADTVFRLGGHSAGAVTFDLLWGGTVFGLACAVVVGRVVRRPPRALCWPPLVWVGRISYGLYLWHFPAIRIAVQQGHDTHGLPEYAAKLIGVAAALALAVASYYLLERPLLRYKRHFPPGRRAEQSVPHPVAVPAALTADAALSP